MTQVTDSTGSYILIVDDIPSNLKVLGNTLHNLGYKFEFATSGASALQWLAKKQFDLVLLDIMMPEMDGLEVCRRIRQNPSWQTIPVLFLTAKNDKESLLEGFRIGGQDYITKPFDTQELAARVSTHLELRGKTEELNRLNSNLEQLVLQRTEELARANDELKVLDTAKNEFMKIISHELRTPLNGIVGPLQIITATNKNADLERWLEMLHESVARLERFTMMALRITELHTGTECLRKELFSVYKVVSGITDTLMSSDRVDIQGVNIHQQLFADREMIGECIEVLIGNALKHSPKETIVTVQSLRDMDMEVLLVQDNGKGFTAEQKLLAKSVFSNGSEHIDSNTGLPLKMVALVADRHGGQLLVHSLASGSVLELRLPVYE